jgi:very-long-chain (3R)-3-hydroxyacyl-CoA dehydratase
MTSPKDMYLILYNSACCAGWALILAMASSQTWAKTTTSNSPSSSSSLAALPAALAAVSTYAPVAKLLYYTQLAALLEIVHAAVGMVRSPVGVTAMQVSSRIVALLAVTYSSQAQCKFQQNRLD